eukprot:4365939-Prymnesium_polylepis.2
MQQPCAERGARRRGDSDPTAVAERDRALGRRGAPLCRRPLLSEQRGCRDDGKKELTTFPHGSCVSSYRPYVR